MKHTLYIFCIICICAFSGAQEKTLPLWMRQTLQGEELVRQGRFPDALEYFRKAESSRPRSTRVLMNIAVTNRFLARKGRSGPSGERYRTYIRYLKKVLALDPAHEDARFYLDVHLGIVAEKIPFAESEAEEFYTAGLDAMKTGAFSAADELFQKGLRIEQHPDLYKSLGVSALQQGQTQEARAYLNDSIRIHPIQHDAYMILGDIAETRGRNAEARLLYIKALASYPHYFKAMQKISVITRKMERPVRFLNITDPVPPGKQDISPDDRVSVMKLSRELRHNMFELRCWLAYHRALALARTRHARERPGTDFTHTAAVETSCISAMLQYYSEHREQAGTEIKTLGVLAALEKKGFLEAAVYFYRWRDEFAAEFIRYRKEHFRKFVSMFEEHL